MKNHISLLLSLLSLPLTLFPSQAGALSPAPTGSEGFVRNVGQVHGPARYYAVGQGSAVYFEPTSVVLDRTPATADARGVILRVDFPGAVGTPRLEGLDPQTSRVNVFLGSDPASWQEGTPVCREVRYQSIAPGSDLVYRIEGGRLKYDVVLAPQGDLTMATLRYRGAERLSVDGTGALVIHTGAGELREAPPVLYQVVDGQRVSVNGGYRIRARREVGFWAGTYDHGLPLFVDPGMMWSTYLGGTATDYACAITRNLNDEVFVVGYSASTDYPTTPGSYQTTKHADDDVVVTKLRSDGSLLWSTYLGGSRWDAGRAVAVDASGNVYVCGETLSEDFPTTTGAFRRQIGMSGTYDAFVTKIGPNGNVLAYSTYLGGISDDRGAAIAVDAAGQAVVGGSTGSTDFPTTSGVVKSSRSPGLFDGSDGFVTKLAANGAALVYSTYLGSNSGTESVRALTLDAIGQPTMTGPTASPDYPTTAGAFQRTLNGIKDSYVTRLNVTASGYVFSTLLGGTGIEDGYGVGMDATGNAYVVGATTSTDFPTTAGAFQTTWGGGTNVYDAFVTKFSPTGVVGYSTFLGGSGSDVAYGVAVSSNGYAFVTGVCTSTNFPVTQSAAWPSYAGGQADGFATAVAPSGSALFYSTFLGSSGTDQGQAITLRSDNRALIAGYTDDASFPTTQGAFDRTYGSGGDGYVSLIDMGVTPITGVGLQGPSLLHVYGPSPNPSGFETSCSASLEQSTRVRVRVLDVQGRLVRSVAHQEVGSGLHTWKWDGTDELGRRVEAGIYLFQISTPTSQDSKRVVRLK